MTVNKSTICGIALRLGVLLFFSAGMLWRCANPAAPQGGPKDTLPPRVVAMTPAYGTKNFTEKRIFIEFDEYVNLKDQTKEFYTSPFMGKTPTLMIRGRGVQISLRDTLKENTTYSLNFGASIADNNEGNILHNLRYVLSTGPEIDSMIMSGYTGNAETADSVSKAFIFFYDAVRDTVPQYDSLLLLHKPDVVGRSSGNGIFIAENLKPIEYKMYAVEDNNNNQQYDPGVDRVAFMDSLYNPAEMPMFRVWYDTARRYVVADPQVNFRLFMDKGFQRQVLSKSERPSQHRINLYFGGAYPRIDSLAFEGIDSTQIITEYLTPHKDSITLWLALPSEDLPDTIKGGIKYMKHDSLRVLRPSTEELKLVWKPFVSKSDQREREKQEKADEKERQRIAAEQGIPVDSVVLDKELVNPFKYTFGVGRDIKPTDEIGITFDYPLVKMDTNRIELIRLANDGRMFRVRHTVSRDTMNIRKWAIRAQWQEGEKYRLTIADSAFVNILGEVNDSIKGEMTVLDHNKYATIVLNVKPQTENSRYIVQIISGATIKNSKVVSELAHVGEGRYEFRYIDPGAVRIRIVDDVNDNGKWDTGDLVRRIQPERIEIFSKDGVEEIATKAGWEIEFEVDMAELFAPMTMERLMDKLAKAEAERLRKAAQDAAAKRKKK